MKTPPTVNGAISFHHHFVLVSSFSSISSIERTVAHSLALGITDFACQHMPNTSVFIYGFILKYKSHRLWCWKPISPLGTRPFWTISQNGKVL